MTERASNGTLLFILSILISLNSERGFGTVANNNGVDLATAIHTATQSDTDLDEKSIREIESRSSPAYCPVGIEDDRRALALALTSECECEAKCVYSRHIDLPQFGAAGPYCYSTTADAELVVPLGTLCPTYRSPRFAPSALVEDLTDDCKYFWRYDETIVGEIVCREL